jgi:anti-sigma regulatory factor (Ser/Thr protein kinase)
VSPSDDPVPLKAGRTTGPVVLRFTPLPEHVRTARLVAMSVARRAGLDGGVLEAVRLAVGEACSRAVQRTESAESGEMVQVDVSASPRALVIEVTDGAGDDGIESEEVALLLMEGLADDVEVTAGPGGPGGTTRLTWRL